MIIPTAFLSTLSASFEGGGSRVTSNYKRVDEIKEIRYQRKKIWGDMKNPHEWKYVHITEIECKKCTDKCGNYIGTDPLTLNKLLEQTEKRKEEKKKK